MSELCLVSCSGGLDSSSTLAMLKLAGYENVVACYFNYNHRGGDCEKLAITNVVDELTAKGMPVTLKEFDLSGIYEAMGSKDISMLENPEAEVTTGTAKGLKTLHAWHPGRNMMFMTVMASYAESLVMKHGYDKVYLLGGFLNLTESGHYPDNSEYFLQSCLELFNYGTLIGNRITPLYGLSNLMKSDQWELIKHFDLWDVIKHTISCDRPYLYSTSDGDSVSTPHNCMKDGLPACGSGLLSYWSSKMVGIDDMNIRNFYEVDDPDYQPYMPVHINEGKTLDKDIYNIIDRIQIPEDRKSELRSRLGG